MKSFDLYREENIKKTISDIHNSVSDDLLIIQTIKVLSDLNIVINSLVKRLREWYELYLPEISKKVRDHEKFVSLVIDKDKSALLEELKLQGHESMGADLKVEDVAAIINYAKKLKNLYELKSEQERYLDVLMKRVMPNTTILTGSLIGAKLLEQAGSLKHLSEFPSTTIQLLGAEKALFRHLKTKARCPKYGILHEHPLISKTKKQMHGKAARALADKISIACKVDYFKGNNIADKLKSDLEKKFGAW